jgi:hypothetical protein
MDPRAVERRCPNCGALVSAEVSWCGQCYASLERREPPRTSGPAPADRSGARPSRELPGAEAEDHRVTGWPCPVCGTDNPIEVDACTSCGTTFGELLSLDARREPVGPRDALAWSLVYPGIGHQRLGLGLDGLARGILFTMTFGMALLLGLGGAGGGLSFAVFVGYVLLAIGTYGLTAVEAYRVAQGASLFVPSRPLMWVTVGLMLVSVLALALTVAATSAG